MFAGCKNETLSGSGGVIYAPNHPHKYFIDYCYEWIIRCSLSNSHIMLVIENFILEGSQGE